uniref:Uncharacterized protein n=1 Tax=Chelonoidis abingdonii TaxID=106734 RepID=A0A8C0GDM4_CHEAB
MTHPRAIVVDPLNGWVAVNGSGGASPCAAGCEGKCLCHNQPPPLGTARLTQTPCVCLAPWPARTCPPNQFSCASGRCIPISWTCDLDDDCGDRSDESCNSGRCIPVHWTCDGDNDCGDYSDETHANCTNQGEPPPPGCRLDGLCIPMRWRCDGDTDCMDSSDEKSCEGVTHVCDPNVKFGCKDSGNGQGEASIQLAGAEGGGEGTLDPDVGVEQGPFTSLPLDPHGTWVWRPWAHAPENGAAQNVSLKYGL